ncbi:hypothetical protein GCM10010218_00260 [Streptomyces mashuensis]|uniref:Uncharacterized protein n=1 Tax=Streptomyces mashuensis TaxID=33904 RepID=A0A919E8K1_9ACTN|nr:hypothetical protein GCM10010218_00260 [Streptomyces mashuensis]
MSPLSSGLPDLPQAVAVAASASATTAAAAALRSFMEDIGHPLLLRMLLRTGVAYGAGVRGARAVRGVRAVRDVRAYAPGA